MADEQTRKFELPWGTLLPVLAALGGVISQIKPLVSTRPAVPGEKAVGVTAEQDVDARLWQDPIAVAQKQLEAEIKAGRGSEPNSVRHDIRSLADLLSERARIFNKKDQVLLLAVMLEAGPYSEQGESRLRTRQAVLEGLSESGFLPIDSEHIGFVTTSWPPQEKVVGSPLPVDRGLLLPWEECEPITDPKGPQDTENTQNIKRIVVVWLPAASFNPDPLRRFAALTDRLAGQIRDKITVKLIGPANSTGLQNMVREVQRWSLSPETQKALDGVSIISPRATASDQTLLYQASAPTPSTAISVEELLKKSITNPARGGLTFVRTIATDDRVLRKAIEELELRRIHLKKRTGEHGPWESGDHVVILTEWDTPYGRSLNTTFAAEAFGRSVKEIIESQPYSDKTFSGEREKQISSDLGRRVHSYRYLRGIDGQLPGDSGKDNSHEQGQKNQSARDTVAVEATEGLNQSDYLRRLARELKEANARWQQEDNQGICAIGLLGSDIYDKMMILRALRPEFPNAIFFTNNYDAHFERRDAWDDTHNLIIASPFGASLPSIYTQQHVAPFRDSDQTSMYVGTLVATGRMDKGVPAGSFVWQPRIFEISRRGAQDLSQPWYAPSYLGIVFADSNKSWFTDWFFSGAVPWRVAGAGLALLAIAAWVGVTIASRTLQGGGTTPQRLRRVLASTVFWLACGGPIIVLGVAAFAQYGSAAEEPLAFLSGISIWPTEMLRLIVIMLAVLFLIKAGIDLRSNERKLTDLYRFQPLPLTRFRLADLGVGLEQWYTSRAKTPRPKVKFSAEEAWHFYLRRNRFWARFIRIAILVTLYAVFSFCLLSLFPRSIPPARGEMAFQFDAVVVFLSTISSMILSFYVVDAIGLSSNFIRMFAREVTKWKSGVVRASHRNPPLSDEELSAYHEIFFVAERTQVVSRLIWYPLVALSLLFVARCSFFDNWSWPISLVVIFVLNAAWPIGSAVLLRRAAEQLREAALSNLQLLRIKGRTIEGKREMFDELIAEIRALKKGAFAPLSEQPFVRAIIVPSGGLGLIAIAQRFLGSF